MYIIKSSIIVNFLGFYDLVGKYFDREPLKIGHELEITVISVAVHIYGSCVHVVRTVIN